MERSAKAQNFSAKATAFMNSQNFIELSARQIVPFDGPALARLLSRSRRMEMSNDFIHILSPLMKPRDWQCTVVAMCMQLFRMEIRPMHRLLATACFADGKTDLRFQACT